MKKNLTIKNNIPASLLERKRIRKNNSLASVNINKIFVNLDKRRDSFHSLSKKFQFNFKKKSLNKYKRFKKIIILGMGGSILGVEAIHCFFKHKIKKDFIFLDNLDEIKIRDLVYEKKLKNSLFIIVSKSGNTIETLTNINLLKKKLDSSNTILVTENNNNSLNTLSKKIKTKIIDHKKYIGGRYSVLSEAGMVPAYLMGLKIDKFRKNLLEYFKGKKKKLLADSVAKISEMYLSKKITSIIFLSYSPQLSEFAYWCQQLLAESLGKKGKGLLPIVSIGPKDHHSLLQLYLDGPKDKMFYVLSSKNIYNHRIGNSYIDKKTKFLKNKNLNKIISSQKEAFVETLRKKNIPFREIYINNFSEEILGELFSYFMLETAMIGKLIEVNPFNQPSVESVKILTKKYLG